MNIFKKIYRYCSDKFLNFRLKRKDTNVTKIVRKSIKLSTVEIESKLNDVLALGEDEAKPIINQIIENVTSAEIAETLSQNEISTETKKPMLSLSQLQEELNRLNSAYYTLEIKYRQINLIPISSSLYLEEGISRLQAHLLKHNQSNAITQSNKSLLQFTDSIPILYKLIPDDYLIKKYHKSEFAKKKQEELFKRQLKVILSEIDALIAIDKLKEAKSKINDFEKLQHIARYPNILERLTKIKTKLKSKEYIILQKIEAEIIRKQAIETERLKAIEIEKQKSEQEERALDFVIDEVKDAVLEEYKIDYLFHMTDVSNLPNILQYGLLSHNLAHCNELNQTDIALQEVNNRRARKSPIYGISLHNYVPMYFNPKNPMLYLRKNIQRNIIILAIDRRAIYQDKSMFTDGNAASDSTMFYTDISKLNKLNWACIRDEYWTDYLDGKREKCSETLAYPKITIKHIKKVYCSNMSTKNIVESQSPRNKTYQVELKSKYYF